MLYGYWTRGKVGQSSLDMFHLPKKNISCYGDGRSAVFIEPMNLGENRYRFNLLFTLFFLAEEPLGLVEVRRRHGRTAEERGGGFESHKYMSKFRVETAAI